MATEESHLLTTTRGETAPESGFVLEHGSIILVGGALLSVVGDEEWAWPVATILLASAYLMVYLRSRSQ